MLSPAGVFFAAGDAGANANGSTALSGRSVTLTRFYGGYGGGGSGGYGGGYGPRNDIVIEVYEYPDYNDDFYFDFYAGF